MMRTIFLGLSLTILFPLDDGRRPPAKNQASNEPASTSRLKVVVWDFGILAPGKEARHRFTITNTSTTTWTVKNVTKTCACAVGELSSREVKPGATTSLDVVFRAPAKEGTVHQAIMVEFENPKDPLFNLAIRGEARNPVSAVPTIIDFGRVATGTRPTQIVELRNYTDHDLEIVKVEAPEGIRVAHERGESKETEHRPRQVWTLTIHLDPAKVKADPRTAALVVHTNAKTPGPVRIPVIYRGQALLAGNPVRLSFGIVELGQTAEKSILVEASPALGALTDKDLVVKHPWANDVEVTVARTASAQRFLVTLRWKPRGPARVAGNVEITVRDKTAPPVRVYVTGAVP
jgi:hypothetical protein